MPDWTPLVVFTDSGCTIVAISSNAVQYLGQSAERLRGVNFVFFLESDRSQLLAAVRELRAPHLIEAVNWLLPRGGEPIPVRFTIEGVEPALAGSKRLRWVVERTEDV